MQKMQPRNRSISLENLNVSGQVSLIEEELKDILRQAQREHDEYMKTATPEEVAENRRRNMARFNSLM